MTGLAAEALKNYINWLNKWFEADPLPDQVQLTEDDFYRYGETLLLGEILPKEEDSQIIHFQAGYGDDGGPAYITAAFDLDTRYKGEPFLMWMVQDFDSTPSLIFGADNHGVLNFLNIPQPK